MILTTLTPIDIVGKENMETFIDHLNICNSSTNAGCFPHDRLNREIGPGVRQHIADTLRVLRENGFYPAGVENGKVKWLIVTKSASHELFEEGLAVLQGLDRDRLASIARKGWKQIIKQVKVEKPPHLSKNPKKAVMYGDGLG